MICIPYEKLCQGIWSQCLLPSWSSTSSHQRQNYRVKHRLRIWGKRKKNNHPPLILECLKNLSVLTTALTVHENLSCRRAVSPISWELVIVTVSKTNPDRKLLTATQTIQFFPLHMWSNLKILKTNKQTKHTQKKKPKQSNPGHSLKPENLLVCHLARPVYWYWMWGDGRWSNW